MGLTFLPPPPPPLPMPSLPLPPPPQLPSAGAPPPLGTAPPAVLCKDDPALAPFFKMVRVGVPAAAVALKMQAAGLDGRLLETPDAPSPYGTARAPTNARRRDGSSDSDSD
eukprot:EG_transcript_34863